MKRYLIVFACALLMGLCTVSPVAAHGACNLGKRPMDAAMLDSQVGTWPAEVNDWLQKGGPIPQCLVRGVMTQLVESSKLIQGCTIAELCQKYASGGINLDFMGAGTNTLSFRASYGGTAITVILDNY